MYYDLTKKEYKAYEKEFKKTYIGKQWFVVYDVATALFIISYFIPYSGLWFDKMPKESFVFDQFAMWNLAFMIALAIGVVIIQIEYRRELKNYIIEKNKK